MRRAYVHRIAAAAPNDMSGIEAAIARGDIEPAGIVAIFGKTEGNGCVNDFTRGFAVQSLRLMLARHVSSALAEKIVMVMSGGVEGALSPHWLVFEAREAAADGASPALAIGAARTPPLPFAELGRKGQALMVARGVEAAMAAAGLAEPAQVHYAQVKCPLLTAERIARATGPCVTHDTLKSMGFSRGASALGVGLALGEIAPEDVTDERICADASLFCTRAGASAGVELEDHEIMVAGMSTQWRGPLVIDHAVMADAIDIEPARAALARLGFSSQGQVAPSERRRLHAALAKAEASSNGLLRGARHAMLEDSDISATRHARAFAGGALAGLFGFTELFVSGGAEHQGPDGGGPIALIASRN